MKILMQGRFELNNGGGGDKIQIENTASELRKLGVEVDIKHRLISDISKYDLLHTFQLDWTAESYFYATNAKKNNKPFVLSPIHHNINEVKKFDDDYAFDYRRISKYLFRDQLHRDTFKNIYRSILNPQKIKPTIHSVFMGLRNMHTKVLKMSDMVLVQTNLEAFDLKDTYNVDFKWEKIPNGVGSQFLNVQNYKNRFNISDYIVSVGRVEPRKSWLNIIDAVAMLRKESGRDIELILIGPKNITNHFEYTARFNFALRRYKWVKYIDSVPYDEMPSVYKFAKVCVSASWFESTGLTLLEAIFCGTNAVASGERAKEYLGNMASYCEPGDVKTIFSAIEKEYFAPRPKISTEMKKEYTWENAAKKTLEVYSSVLNRKKANES